MKLLMFIIKIRIIIMKVTTTASIWNTFFITECTDLVVYWFVLIRIL